MKTYTMTLEIPEGSDEFWDELAQMKNKRAKEELRHAIAMCLGQSGFDHKIKMGKTIVNG